jgi:hypothetical protein
MLKPEFVAVPVKGRRTNFPVCLEELMNCFPCSRVVAGDRNLLSCIIQLTKIPNGLNVGTIPKHPIIVENAEYEPLEKSWDHTTSLVRPLTGNTRLDKALIGQALIKVFANLGKVQREER